MKKSLQSVLLSLVTGFTTLAISPTISAEEILLDKVVAVVNERIILKSELNSKLYEQAQALQAQNIPVRDTASLREQVLNSMIYEVLQVERAAQTGLNVSDDEINTQMQAIAQKNNLSLYELRNRLNIELQDGFQKAREKIKKQILIQKLREREVLSQAQVTENEIQNFLKRQQLATKQVEIRLGHILIALPESASPQQRDEALAKAQDVKARLQSGEDFNQLAVRYSNGAKALTGGDLGWMKEQEVPTFFTEALQGLAAGDVSKVIQSPSGFHLIKLNDKTDSTATQVTTQYHLHRFIVLSDTVDRFNTPADLLATTKAMDSIQDFQKLFETYPDIPKEVNADSDLGWRTLDKIPSVLQDDIAKLAAKKALAPLATEKGWMILYLDDIRKTTDASDEDRQKAVQAIRSRKANEMFDLWLRRLRDEAFVQIK